MLNNDSNTDREKVEGYLAHKWGLVGSLSAVMHTGSLLLFQHHLEHQAIFYHPD